DLANADPAPFGGSYLDRLAHRLEGEPVGEAGRPRAARPVAHEVDGLVHERLAVADPLPDRPAERGVRMAGVLGADPAHAVQGGFVRTVAVQQLVEAWVVEDQGALRAVG